MNFLKSLFALLLVSTLVFSCKSEKNDDSSTEDAVEEVAAESSAEAGEESAEAAANAEEGAEETAVDSTAAASEEEAPAEEKKLTVYYPKDSKLAGEVEEAIKELVKGNPTIEQHFYDADSFVIFPKITKAGLGIGGAGGKGLVFDEYKVIGEARLAQGTFGLQAGGQQYMEVIFFEDQAALDRFKGGKLKFSGQASAVALKDGASVDIDYQDGVAVFTKVLGGLMAEASIGGQDFKYKDGIN